MLLKAGLANSKAAGGLMSEAFEIILKGLSVSKGIAMGTPFYLAPQDEVVPEQPIPPVEVESEIARYRSALQSSRSELLELQKTLLEEGSDEAVAILDTHLEMLKDPLMTTEMEQKIRKNQKNTESVFQKTISEFQNRFICLKDSFFQERVKDITDVSKRILRHLSPQKKFDLQKLPKNSVLFALDVIPSVVAEANPGQVIGIISHTGGVSSHAAIIARAKGIPYIGGIDIELLKNQAITSVIVDGNEGLVILNPTPKTWNKYVKLSEKAESLYQSLASQFDLKAETIDGYPIELYGNLENLDDIEGLTKHRASGIGLFRSEYLFLARKSFPTEEEQYQACRKILEKIPENPVIIRVFDIGGDKKGEMPLSLNWKNLSHIAHELNPVLGCRAIRFLLKYQELFEKQLRALLRASTFGNIHILLPMVSDTSEIIETKKLINKIRKELQKEKIAVKKHIPIGCMIEVPSSAIMCDAIAEEADFLSIGTNDLIQYVVAADRSNSTVSHLYSPAHPSILRLLRHVVMVAERRKKSLILCGEVAADPKFIPFLLGTGIRKLSVAARHIPEVKHVIRSISLVDACRRTEKAFRFTSYEDLKEYILG